MDSSRNQLLGINKHSKQIRKPSPSPPPPHPPPPQIYNICKNDFRAVVQQLTGSPSRDYLLPGPPSRPRPPNSRLLEIRPPPLSSIAPALPPNPNSNPRAPAWAGSPVSAYMRYLESSLLGPVSSSRNHPPPPFPSPRSLALPSPRGIMSPNAFLPPPPTSPLLSPSVYLNLLSPKSPYPPISPGFQYPETLGAGTRRDLQEPPSPRLFFPQSPSGSFPSRSPKWRDKDMP